MDGDKIQRADLSRAENDELTPLHAAASDGHLEKVQVLIGHGADLNSVDKFGLTPLYAASFNGHLDIVKFLISQGADLKKADQDGRTPLFAASFNGHLDVVQFLIGNQGADLNRVGRDGSTPLEVASLNGHLDVQFLIGQGADLNKLGRDGSTPLEVASMKGHVDVVQFLIGQQADLNRAGNDGSTPLEAASLKGHLDVVQFLIGRGADLNSAGIGGRTPLQAASFKGHLNVIQFVIGQGADVNKVGRDGSTPLEVASLKGQLDVVQFLIAKGADLNMAGIGGHTPLQAASFNDPARGVEKQVDNEANVQTSKLKQLNLDSSSSGQVVEDVIRDSMEASDQQPGSIRIEKYGIEVQFHPSEIWGVDDIQAVPEVPAELADLLTEDQAIICKQQETLFHKSLEVNVRFVVNTSAADQSKVFVQFILEQSAKIEIICPMNLSGDHVTPRAKGTQKPTDSTEVTDMHLLRISQELLPAHFSALHLTLGIKPSIAQGILTQKINDYPDTYMHLLQLWKTESHRTLRDLDQVLVESKAGGLKSKYKQEQK
ncbi:ankyrin repeat domain-containing protein 50-like [Strongylocentrotus purpuratus]|uniref:Uncharacterized protein n=1 Tax=Strongylocentrotus purpuratus TaxID=7668 RepID=A0A7M7PCA3_STRPU|nr:ankyrin repeat domain-containing protein 50-like [Strongylocentrotus purpuratus]